MTKEEKIKEVIELVAKFGERAQIAARADMNGTMQSWRDADNEQCLAFSGIESKLRELIK